MNPKRKVEKNKIVKGVYIFKKEIRDNENIITFDKSMQEESFLRKVKSVQPDLAVVCSFNKKLPKELLRIPKDGVVNLHPSKLPDYRGGNPYSHVIINGEKESAITLHYMDENFDTGIVKTVEWYLR